MLYLPLDKLLEKANARDNEQPTVVSGRDDGSSAGKEPESVTVEARGRGDR